MPSLRLRRDSWGQPNKALHQTPLHVHRHIVSDRSK